MGLYIHYPWCRRRCDYCDFAIAVRPLDQVPQRAYRDAVIAELHARADRFEGRELVSVYFGGGTPSLWPPGEIRAVLDAATSRFGVDSLVEVTLEANPIDCTAEALAGWREAGVDRVSIGVQSVSAPELAVLGRDHSMGDGPPAVAAAKAAGFERISLDAIVGTPGPGGGGFESLEAIADLEVDHLSVYELTFEQNAPLGRAAARGDISPLGEDQLAELYERADALLVGRGYEHYEISSYARAGARAVHNSLYWHGGEYLGLGSSAASYLRRGDGTAVRETNERSAARYMRRSASETIATREPISASDAEAERLWLALRTSDGAPSAAFGGREKLVRWLLDGGLAMLEEGRIRPTLKGFLYANQVATMVMRYA